jgi:uncharacterized YccA/Bax inhibitor family protein
MLHLQIRRLHQAKEMMTSRVVKIALLLIAPRALGMLWGARICALSHGGLFAVAFKLPVPHQTSKFLQPPDPLVRRSL